MTYLIAPSLLSADITRLGEEVEAVLDAGADLIHLDVMDNHYVPNLTFGPLVCQALIKRKPDLILDVHLMASPVDSLIAQFAKAGASRLSIHPDATNHLDRSLQWITQNGMQAGLVLNPATSPECLRWCKHRIDFVVVMTVNPGFAGQELIEDMLEKITWIQNCYPDLPIAVDGGITVDNLPRLAQAGASQFITGSTLFSSESYRETLSAMRTALACRPQDTA